MSDQPLSIDDIRAELRNRWDTVEKIIDGGIVNYKCVVDGVEIDDEEFAADMTTKITIDETRKVLVEMVEYVDSHRDDGLALPTNDDGLALPKNQKRKMLAGAGDGHE